jgi:hypothetical protein
MVFRAGWLTSLRCKKKLSMEWIKFLLPKAKKEFMTQAEQFNIKLTFKIIFLKIIVIVLLKIKIQKHLSLERLEVDKKI